MTPIDGLPMKFVTVAKEIFSIQHGNGVFIDFYSFDRFELKNRLSAKDFYPTNDQNFEIHRIELLDDRVFSMNVEFDDETHFFDIFNLKTLTNLRRIENFVFLLRFPRNETFLLRKPTTKTFFLYRNGNLDELNVQNDENIVDFHFFKPNFLLVRRRIESSTSFQFVSFDLFSNNEK